MPPLTEPAGKPTTPPNLPKKSWFRRHPILATILAIPVLLYASCEFISRDQWVRWEEEVLLNTGETIVVKRSVPWTLQAGTGNPFAMGVYPSGSRAILEFKS